MNTVFATRTQELGYARALIAAQDKAGIRPHPTADDHSTHDEQRLSLLDGSFRPPCKCDPTSGPTPCDASLLAVLLPEPLPGCPHIHEVA
jgi:hypothetical protein